MQHGFAARNGLTAALLARSDYSGIERVLERSYGGFLSTFSQGSKTSPPCNGDAVIDGLGERWEINSIRIKPYAAMATLHAPIDCVRALQEEHGEYLKDLENIQSIRIEMGEAAFKHGGWEIEKKPLEVIGAQMNVMYAVAVQLVDGKLLPSSYGPGMINRETLYKIIEKTKCVHLEEYDRSYKTRMSIETEGGKVMVGIVEAPRGISPPTGNGEIVEKWRELVSELIEEERIELVERSVLNLENCGEADLETLIYELRRMVGCTLK